LNYLYCYTFFIAKEALSALKSTGKHNYDAWNMDVPVGNGGRSFCYILLQKCRNIHLIFVMDKFIGVIQPFVIPDFTFISIKIIHYFSYVIRFAPLSCQLY
jgi:hypothetical protein